MYEIISFISIHTVTNNLKNYLKNSKLFENFLQTVGTEHSVLVSTLRDRILGIWAFDPFITLPSYLILNLTTRSSPNLGLDTPFLSSNMVSRDFDNICSLIVVLVGATALKFTKLISMLALATSLIQVELIGSHVDMVF